jgi:hypothetical protein
MNLQDIINQKSANLKETFVREIKSQQEHLASRKAALIDNLLDICTSRYSHREQFTYIAACETTLNTMLTVYSELFGEEYTEPVPVVVAEDVFTA